MSVADARRLIEENPELRRAMEEITRERNIGRSDVEPSTPVPAWKPFTPAEREEARCQGWD